LGGCGEDAALRALAALDEVMKTRALPCLEVSLGSVVPMGGSKRDYTALSALLEQGREAATALLGELRDVLSDAALGRREKRAPKPHITLARPGRRASDESRAAGLSWAEGLDLRAMRARLDRIALYTWAEGNRRERLFQIVAERSLIAPTPSPH
jgi:hypothetical protein